MQIPDHIYILIAKKLDGEASEEENSLLDRWLQKDESHQLTYHQLEDIHHLAGDQLRKPVNAAAAWQKIDAKIAGRSRIVPLKFLKAFSVAAIFILVIAAGWFVTRMIFSDSWNSAIAANTNLEEKLPDGSVVWLRKGSTLEWNQAFAKHRSVKLKGEAYFDVVPDATHPFTVTTPQSLTTVVGTSFTIRSGGGFDQVIVSKGKVNVASLTGKKPATLLSPGDKLVLSKDKLLRSSVSDSNYLAWKTGMLNFKDVSLDRALKAIGDFYQVSISLKPTAGKPSLTASFDHEPIDKVLAEVALITGLQYTLQPDGTYQYYRK